MRLSSKIFVAPDFWSAADCARASSAMNAGRATDAEVYADGFEVDRHARRAFDVDVADAVVARVQQAIDAMRPQVAAFFDMELNADEGPGFLRYPSGGFYGVHTDVAPEWDDEFPRRIAVVVFLTTAGIEGDGGALRLYTPEPADITPRAGTLVAFPADMPHEVLPVTRGVRDVVVDWFY